ncbi:MAG TPA: outer membrane lipoprotein-sorting protein [Candidatus Binatia bacterium]|nr:outer membrane lipoprotein-sorting protein [Candidatus Binatia bacterium]
MRTLLAAAALLPVLLASAGAQPPDADTIIKGMKTALEPPRASTRQIVLTISGVDNETTKWTAVQARKPVLGKPRTLTVVISPADGRGISSLIHDGKKPGVEDLALWIPMVRRVRELVPLGAFEPFLQSDFTYSDLGLVGLGGTHKLIATEKKNGKDAYKVETVPGLNWYYSKVVTWVDTKSMMPVENDYYDPAGQLWKVETIDSVSVIDGAPVALGVTMKDVQTKTQTVLAVTNVKFDVELPDSLFAPENLPKSIQSPVFAGVE